MTPETSPFRPGRPVPVDLFVGRNAAIERLRGLVRTANRGTSQIGFITGERGIGKSSLAAFVRSLCEREGIATGCHVYLGGVHELQEMTRRTFDRLLKDSIDRPRHRQVLEFFGNRIRKVGLFGVSVELALSAEDLRMASSSSNFIISVRELLRHLEERTSLLLILDDINGLAESPDFAHWLKSLVDEIATSQQEMRLCILLVGLEERRRALIRSQPSLARVFDLIDIEPWSSAEAEQFYRKSFSEGNATLPAVGPRFLVRYTGGLPVLAHEIGAAVWHAARTQTIAQEELSLGVVRAAEIIGRRLLEPQIFQAIQSDRYRSILRKMADEPSRMSFQRSDIVSRLTEDERKVMDNFLRRMRSLGALQVDPEVRGGYRFPNRLHALYFWMSQELQRRQRGQRGGNQPKASANTTQ